VEGDKFKLSHVIRNMMSNALKFTEKYGNIDVVTSLESSRNLLVKSTSDIHLVTVDSGGWDCSSCCAPALPDPRPSTPRSNSVGRLGTEDEKDPFELDTLIVAVKDSGFGLSRTQLHELFQDGKQFDPNKLQAGQGSGLGLYLSQKIMRIHGGGMWAESQGENKGATFYMCLPLLTSPTTAPITTQRKSISNNVQILSFPTSLESVEHMSLSPERSGDRRSGRVLVVDDAPTNRKIVCRVLRSRGFECVEARDGQECLKIMKNMSMASSDESGESSHFDCIVMDFEMPVLNGPDATVALRDLGHTLPIIGLTGNVMQEDMQHFLDSGADIVMVKPLDIGEFMKIYQQLVVSEV
jgi:CheY-like chemotaxis protein